MYKQALKNMYKAAAAEPEWENVELFNSAPALARLNPALLNMTPHADWNNDEVRRFIANHNDSSINTDSVFDPHANLGSSGKPINVKDHNGPVTLLKNPEGSPIEILEGQEPGGLPTGEQALTMPGVSKRNALLAALGDKNNYGALAALGAAGLGGLGGAAFGGNADDRILNAITGAAGGAGAVGGARGAMELLEGNVDPLLAAGLGGVTGGIGSGALARLLAKTLMK